MATSRRPTLPLLPAGAAAHAAWLSRQYAVMGTLLVQVWCHTSLALGSSTSPHPDCCLDLPVVHCTSACVECVLPRLWSWSASMWADPSMSLTPINGRQDRAQTCLCRRAARRTSVCATWHVPGRCRPRETSRTRNRLWRRRANILVCKQDRSRAPQSHDMRVSAPTGPLRCWYLPHEAHCKLGHRLVSWQPGCCINSFLCKACSCLYSQQPYSWRLPRPPSIGAVPRRRPERRANSRRRCVSATWCQVQSLLHCYCAASGDRRLRLLRICSDAVAVVGPGRKPSAEWQIWLLAL